MTSIPDLPASPLDLRGFFRAVGHFSGQSALNSTPRERTEPSVPAELLEEDNSAVSGPPLEVAGFVDGIQASMAVTYRSHRPVYLNYVAAGCVGPNARLLAHSEKLNVLCSRTDVPWVESLEQPGLAVEALDTDVPTDLERHALDMLGGDRESRERRLVEDLCAKGVRPLCVDGHLVGRPYRPDSLVGVVKSMGRRYLADESPLFRLDAGCRSAIFKIPANTAGQAEDRFSCYVRLFSAERKAWNFGMVRIESFNPELLAPLASRVLQERQSPAAGDPRFDRHLASVRACEEALRARRPAVFGLSH